MRPAVVLKSLCRCLERGWYNILELAGSYSTMAALRRTATSLMLSLSFCKTIDSSVVVDENKLYGSTIFSYSSDGRFAIGFMTQN